jgi:hypothetical protein
VPLRLDGALNMDVTAFQTKLDALIPHPHRADRQRARDLCREKVHLAGQLRNSNVFLVDYTFIRRKLNMKGALGPPYLQYCM